MYVASAAARDDQRVAEGCAARTLWLERRQHHDQLAAHEIEHVWHGVDAQDVVPETELADCGNRDPELTLGVGGRRDDETGGIDMDVERLVRGEAAPDDRREAVRRDRRRRREQLRCEVTRTEQADVTRRTAGGHGHRRLPPAAGE